MTQGLPSPALAYATIDGLLQQALLKHLSGDKRAVSAMKRDVGALLACRLPPRAATAAA